MTISPSELPEPEYTFTIEELKGLYKAIEHEFIPYENEAAHAAIRKIQTYLRQHELTNPRTSETKD